MAVTKPRNRLVNFRVSEDEFQSLREACETGGARSISDFARCAVLMHEDLDLPSPAGHHPNLASRVALRTGDV